jgi:hypothetical protein
VVIFQVLDPAELNFTFSDPVLFHDLETGRELYVDPSTAGRLYTARLAEHRQAIRLACDRQGIEFHGLATDRPLDLALFDYLRGRLERGHRLRARRSRT